MRECFYDRQSLPRCCSVNFLITYISQGSEASKRHGIHVHDLGVVGSLTSTLLQTYCWMYQWKKIKIYTKLHKIWTKVCVVFWLTRWDAGLDAGPSCRGLENARLTVMERQRGRATRIANKKPRWRRKDRAMPLAVHFDTYRILQRYRAYIRRKKGNSKFIQVNFSVNCEHIATKTAETFLISALEFFLPVLLCRRFWFTLNIVTSLKAC